MTFTLRQVRVFVTLASTLHFGEAAGRLHLSQPAVSADLRNLEAALGVRLIDRNRAGNTLTEAGRAALPWATRMIEDAHQFELSARAEPEVVRLAVSPSMVNRLIPALLAHLEAAPQNVHLDVHEVGTGEGEALVLRGTVDAALGHFLHTEHGFRRLTLGQDPVYVIANGLPSAPGTPLCMASLAGRSLLLWNRKRNPAYYDALLAICRERGLEPTVVESSPLISGPRSYHLRMGQSFSLVPQAFALEAPRSMATAPLTPPAYLPLHLLYHPPATAGMEAIVRGIRTITRAGVSQNGVTHAG
ncbi:LysR family transcriptional regulator [Neoactinobaculum massilliense]|uniref:LysR family transcriptional regulator n=1 Tax=Neoactinobaculum massilliense TaxID=2364794 RepID=UPI000F54AE45|nr:LysR family transcriptional regulator [Neoactinobaculum massilliense]